MISIIIPCYNEEANLQRGVLPGVVAFLKTRPYEWELLVVDDESTDASLRLCKEFERQNENIRVLHISHGGKPSALWAGLKAARGQFVLFSDMDQSTPIVELDKLYGWFDKGFDIVIGSRGLERAGSPLVRRVMSRGFRILRGLFILRDVEDTQCGFKALRTSTALEIFPLLSFFSSKRQAKGWVVSAYDVELLYIAYKWSLPVKQVPVDWEHRDISTTKGQQGSKFLDESFDMARQVLSVITNNLHGRYKRKALGSESHSLKPRAKA